MMRGDFQARGKTRDMTTNKAFLAAGVLLLGTAVSLAPMSPASASKHKTTHHKAKKKKTSRKPSSSNVSSLGCPKQSLITSASGVSFKGPSSQNGGTAACIYTNTAGDDLNVVFETPGESRSKFVATDPSNIGTPAQAVSGIGAAAFSTTTYGHAEIDVYESSSKGFAVTLDPANGGAVTPADLTEVVAVGRAIASGKSS
jgi:hypothetical protein